MQGMRKDKSATRNSIAGLNPKMMKALKKESGYNNPPGPSSNYGSTRNLAASSKLHT